MAKKKVSKRAGKISTKKSTRRKKTLMNTDFMNYLFSDIIGGTELDFDIDSLLESEKEESLDKKDINEAPEKLPFDPSLIRVDFRQLPLDMILRRIEHDELDLNPEFQRESTIWNKDAQSRLIESLLIKIPLPVFFIDGTEEDKWIIVDGLQRLSTFKLFVLDNTLKLQGLEFLKNLNGSTFKELPHNYQRRILESQISIYIIEKGTPKDVKLSIFKRINTGGLPLSDQEIRHALYTGQASRFLNEVVSKPIFKKVTDGGIRPTRMADRECVLRFFAFSITDYKDYHLKDIDGLLNKTMEQINSMDKNTLKKLEENFTQTMNLLYAVFQKDAFRKRYKSTAPRNPINRALFETFSVSFGKLDFKEQEKVKAKKDAVKESFMNLMKDQVFEDSISTGTSEVAKVHYRFSKIEELIKGIINEN